MELTLAARRQITNAQLAKWPKATKAQKSAILDAVCAVTGWHRDHARKVIRQALADQAGGGPPPRRRREPVFVYGPEAVELLTRCWAVLDGPTGKRLHPALPEVLANLERHGHLAGVDPAVVDQVLAMSPATIDRRLAGARTGLVAGKPISHTRPGSMLKSSIPMKTWAEWNDAEPGFLQIDMVGHEGGDNNGEFHFTLDATDVALGWTEGITVRSKGERIVAAGLDELWLRFPFHIAGIHSDNGSEFINHHLARWCQTRKITFTRGRASNKNDQAHVEQKNWSVVRRSVGYFRYDTRRELDLLNQLWPLVSLQGQPVPAPTEADRQNPHRGRRAQTARHRHHPDAPTAGPPRRARRHPRPATPRTPAGEHRPDQPAPPDRRHPGQPHRTRPSSRRHPTQSQNQRRLPQPPQDLPSHAGKSE